jgi:hypothetical protein
MTTSNENPKPEEIKLNVELTEKAAATLDGGNLAEAKRLLLESLSHNPDLPFKHP